jgi:hypothetical protein
MGRLPRPIPACRTSSTQVSRFSLTVSSKRTPPSHLPTSQRAHSSCRIGRRQPVRDSRSSALSGRWWSAAPTSRAAQPGADYLDYSDQAARVVVDLSAGTTQKFDGNFTDTHTSIAGVTGSAFDDTLLGHGGNTYFLYSSGNDTIDGREETDRLDYTNALGAVHINVTTGIATKTVDHGSSPATADGADTLPASRASGAPPSPTPLSAGASCRVTSPGRCPSPR